MSRYLFYYSFFIFIVLTSCDDDIRNSSNTNNTTNNTSSQNNTSNSNNTSYTNNNTNNNTSTALEIPDWTEETHSNDVEPNYSVVFPQNKVHVFNISIEPEFWQVMEDDLEENIGEFNPGPGIDLGDYEPVWVPCTLTYEDKDWYKVGIRFKGNSSLVMSYNMGIKKLSFKLDFDEFEDDYPVIKNQRFYGFKQLNLGNGFEDKSMMHEKAAADLFSLFGIRMASTAFAAVYVDYGEGPVYFGLYTLIEEVDDTVIETKFVDGGNLYKPEDAGATFGDGTFNIANFEKKTNEDEADYSDVEALYNIVNSELRTSDQESWRSQMESIFDIDVFLMWLAANTVIRNWDSYGLAPHNYYLYNDPETEKLTWIPWDHNEAFTSGKQDGVLTLGLDEVDSRWPLIRYLLDDGVYSSLYFSYMDEFSQNLYNPLIMTEKYEQYQTLIEEYAVMEQLPYSFTQTDSDFYSAVEALKQDIQTRYDLVQAIE
ncbi:MAG: CotH kinase family protein [Deltaproteobacteria bacterium]|nr:CotH kinase family protein [Deltaproteobacteria bacterium]